MSRGRLSVSVVALVATTSRVTFIRGCAPVKPVVSKRASRTETSFKVRSWLARCLRAVNKKTFLICKQV